jgi:hypothetical protein
VIHLGSEPIIPLFKLICCALILCVLSFADGIANFKEWYRNGIAAKDK